MTLDKIYASFDIEADGPCPSNSNMVELGISFLTEEGEEIDSFYAPIRQREGTSGDSDTIEWLKKSGVWERAVDSGDARDPCDVFEELAEKLEKISQEYSIIWICYPSSYDWQWLKWYWTTYVTDPEKQKLLGYYQHRI